ncbi:MAG: T9SS type A sorting domain-containing protein [Taibaiella sp.]|nr:T9SS type A sorting domain-containing protein [Taibaiella sp.]
MSIKPCYDKGYILTGSTASNVDYVSGNHGLFDIWLVKLDSTGSVAWQKCLGGSSNDYGYSVLQTRDSNFILAGNTTSTDGNVSGNHGNSDYWVVKVNDTGKILWQKTYGGTSNDSATCIQQTFDGGYIIGGHSSSNNGNVTYSHGGIDYWIVKINDTGKIQWQKTYGGTADELLSSIQQTKDSGYIVAGTTQSNNGDITGYHDSTDIWVIKLNDTGKLIWQKTLGGTSKDIVSSIKQTSTGNYVLAGSTVSTDGDVSSTTSGNKIWIVKLSQTGALLNEISPAVLSSPFRGPTWGTDIIETFEKNYVVSFYPTAGLLKIDSNLSTILWIKRSSLLADSATGVYSGDFPHSIEQTPDSGYILTGSTLRPYQVYDVLLMKFGNFSITCGYPPKSAYCAGDTFSISYVKSGTFYPGNIFKVQLSDTNGQFLHPTIIGQRTDTASGKILCTIPDTVFSSARYTIRVISTNRAMASSSVAADIYDAQFAVSMYPIISGAHSNSMVCSGDTLKLSVSNLVYGTSYTWTGPHGFTFNSPSAYKPRIDTGSAGYYKITASLNTCGAQPDSVLVVVKQSSFPHITLSPHHLDTVCLGGHIMYSIITTDTGLAPVYQWRKNRTVLPGISYAYNDTTLNTGDTIISTLTNMATCASPHTVSDTSVIVVKPLTGLVHISSNSPVCEGDVLHLYSGTSLTGLLLNWQGPASYTSTAPNPDIAAALPAMSGTYRLSAILAGCGAVTDSAIIVVNKSNPTTFSIAPRLHDTICDGTMVHFTSAATNGGPMPLYTWLQNGLLITTGSIDSFNSSTLVNDDVITCTFHSSATCATPLTITDTAIITVYPWLSPSVSVSASPTVIAGDYPITFTAVTNEAGPTPLFQWKNNGIDIPHATSSVYTAIGLKAGDAISVSIDINAPCTHNTTATSNTIDLIAGNLLTIKGLVLYPNPNNGAFNIRGDLDDTGMVTINIYNALSQLLYQTSVNVFNKKIDFPLNLDNGLADGIYTVRITVGTQSTSLPFTIVH